jgi:hypothetical protein
MTKTKVKLEEELDDLSDTMQEIFDEADSGDPDIDRIRELAADGLGIEEELHTNEPEPSNDIDLE